MGEVFDYDPLLLVDVCMTGGGPWRGEMKSELESIGKEAISVKTQLTK